MERESVYEQFHAVLTPTLLPYLAGVVHALREFEGTTEEKALMLDNVWSEVSTTLTQLCGHRESSQHMEVLVAHSSPLHLRQFIAKLAETKQANILLVSMAANPFGAFVLDALIYRVIELCHVSTDNATILVSLSEKLSKLSGEDLSKLFTQKSSAIFVRHLLQALCGHSPMPAPHSKHTTLILPNDAIELSAAACHAFIVTALDKLSKVSVADTVLLKKRPPRSLYDLSFHEIGTFIVQDCLRAAAKPRNSACLDRCLRSLFNEEGASFSDEGVCALVCKLMKVPSASHAISTVLSPPALQPMADALSKNNDDALLPLARHAIGCHPLQRLISRLRPDALLQALIPHVEALLKQGRVVVLCALLDRSHGDLVVQSELVKALRHALPKKKFIEALFSLPTPPPLVTGKKGKRNQGEVKEEEAHVPSKFSSSGCRLLAQWLHLDATHSAPICKELLALPVTRLCELACDGAGSRVLEALASPPVPIRLRLALLDALRSQFGTLAQHTIGSRVVEKLYEHADLAHKELVVKELLTVSSELAHLYHGDFVLKACKVDLFVSNKKLWRRTEKKAIAKAREAEGEKSSKKPNQNDEKGDKKQIGNEKATQKRKRGKDDAGESRDTPHSEPAPPKKRRRVERRK